MDPVYHFYLYGQISLCVTWPTHAAVRQSVQLRKETRKIMLKDHVDEGLGSSVHYNFSWQWVTSFS